MSPGGHQLIHHQAYQLKYYHTNFVILHFTQIKAPLYYLYRHVASVMPDLILEDSNIEHLVGWMVWIWRYSKSD